MTLDYLYCEKHFNKIIQGDPEVLEMFEQNEKKLRVEFIPGNCDTCETKESKPCGKKGYAIIKFVIDEESEEIFPMEAIPYTSRN